jgi:hypothetical protein
VPSSLYLSSDIFLCLLHFYISLIFAWTSGPDPPLHFTSHSSSTSTVSSEPIMVVFILVYAQNLFKLLSRLVQQVITNLSIYNIFWDHQIINPGIFNVTPGIPFPFTNRSHHGSISFVSVITEIDASFKPVHMINGVEPQA